MSAFGTYRVASCFAEGTYAHLSGRADSPTHQKSLHKTIVRALQMPDSPLVNFAGWGKLKGSTQGAGSQLSIWNEYEAGGP
ncbi:MAG: hypothetical protein KDA84_26665, partial [Planctomycetaceae bacterium]|nr:hypothetical protein [Planctomycetaceae bacterium]